MDYRQLLYKFLGHIMEVEDSNSIELINTPFSSIPFTDDEIQSLHELVRELTEGGEGLIEN